MGMGDRKVNKKAGRSLKEKISRLFTSDYKHNNKKTKENSDNSAIKSNDSVSISEKQQAAAIDKAELNELKLWLGDTKKEFIWIFNSGNSGEDFRGNPKYLFAYIYNYKPEMKAVWLSNSDETVEFIRNLGFKAYNHASSSAGYLFNIAGVMVDEQVRYNVPSSVGTKYLNLWHGWGFKPVERGRIDDDDDLRFNLCPKYIINSTFYQNNQIVCVVNSLQEEYFLTQMGVGRDNFLRAGYARCIYQKKYNPIKTFNHNILEEKGLDRNTKIAVYAPTFRKNRGNTFADALPDLEKLYDCCEKKNILLILKMHPLMENEEAFQVAKETLGGKPYFLFWDNKNDIYEIMHKVDLLIYDYSSIFSDFLLAGVKNFIRYIFDGDDMAAAAGMNSDDEYFNNSRGKICRNFDELLNAINNGDYDDGSPVSLEDFIKTQWEYAGDDDMEKIIDFTLNFKVKDTVYPTLYSFDIFDTLISRKGLEPDSISYAMRDSMRKDFSHGFDSMFVERFPAKRLNAELGLREYMNKSLEQRHTIKREITLSMIYDEIQMLENLTDEQKDYLIALECKTEIDSIIPIKDNINTVKELLKNHEDVIFISDMYLPMSVIKKMLSAADPALEKVKIFLSNEYGTLKTDKDLFFEVYRSIKPFYNYGKWIHTGDNRNADQKQPRLMGIETRHIQKPTFSNIEKSLSESIGTYDSFKTMALQARMRNSHSFKSADFVIDYIAPLFVSYIDWVLRDAIKKGFETLYFVSRDGHHLKRIADAIIQKRGLSIKTKYIYASRRVWRIPSFINAVDEEFFANYGGNFNDIHTKEKFLRAAAFDSEADFNDIFPQIDLDNIDFNDVSNGSPAKKLSLILKSNQKYHEYLLNRAASQRGIVCDYLLQEINPQEKHAFVEFFGRGYNQTCHSRLWNHAIGRDMPLYYYYARALLPSEGNCIRYKMTSTNIQFFFIESIFANMPYKSIEEYTVKNGKIVPVKLSIQCNKDLFDAMELLLPEYATRYASLDLENPEGLSKSIFDALLYYYRDHQSEQFIYKNIGSLVDAVSMFGEKRVFARPYTQKDIENFKNGVPRTRGTMSVEMSYMQSDPMTKIEYDQLYQIEPGDNCATGAFLSESEIKKSKKYEALYEKLLNNAKSFSKSYYRACEKIHVNRNQVLVLHRNNSVPDALKSVVSSISASDSLNCIVFSCKKLNKEAKIKLAEMLASSAFVIINDYIPILSTLKLRENSKMIAIESSAFELVRKGYNIKKRIKSIKKYHKALFDMDVSALTAACEFSANEIQMKYGIARRKNQIICGSPVTDILFDKSIKSAAKEKLYEIFPQAEGKKILVYLPNLRKIKDKDYYYNLLDIERLKKLIGDEYVVIIDTRNKKKSLKSVPNKLEIEGFSKIINSKIGMRKLLILADVIVGDFRDTLFESVLLNKPIFFSGFDYEDKHHDENFVLDYTKDSPFPLVRSSEELFEKMKNLKSYDYAPQIDFKNKYLTFCDGKSGKKVCEFIEKSIEQ